MEHTQYITLYTSSSVLSNGSHINATGNEYTVQLTQPISIGQHFDARVRCLSLKYWFNFPNISAALANNTLNFHVGGTPYSIVLQDGLYNIDALNLAFSTYFVNNGLADDLFTIDGIEATGYTAFTINSTTTVINLPTSNIAPILGFTVPVNLGPPAIAGTTYNGNTEATLNSLTSVNLKCSFADGSYFLGAPTGVIASSSPTVEVGSQVIYEPYNPSWARVVGKTIGIITLTIVDQNGNDLNTQGENFEVTLEIMIYPKDNNYNR